MKRLRLRWLRRAATILIFLVAVEYLVLPQIAGTRNALRVVRDVNPTWVVSGVVLEALSLVSYSLLTRSVLPDQRPSFLWLLRADLTSLGVSHIVPGGAATASTLRYHLLREGGTPPEDAVVGEAVESVGSALVLIAMLFCAIVLSIPLGGLHRIYVTAAAVGAAVILLSGMAVFGLIRPDSPFGAITRHAVHWLPARLSARVERALRQAANQLTQLLTDSRGLRVSVGWAVANWLLDGTSLWVFLAAFGWRADPIEVAVGYGLANVLGGLPITPGGLGIIEGVLIPSLVGFGAPRAAAVLGVVSWRLFEFWVPIPLAAVCYVSLRTEERRGLRATLRRWADFFALVAPRSGKGPKLEGSHSHKSSAGRDHKVDKAMR